MKKIAQYIGIGILLGIGISISDYIYYQAIKKHHFKEMEEVVLTMKDVFDDLFVSSFESIFNNPRKYDPAMGLNFSLQEYQLNENILTVTGTVSNVGVDQWSALSVQVEAFSDGNIIAECNEILKDLEPGDWEAIITECPILEMYHGKQLTNLSFKIKKSFHDKKHVPYNNSFNNGASSASDLAPLR